MKQLLKRIFNFLLVLLFCIGSVFFIITKYFSNNIERSIISKIQQNMQTPLILNDVAFTFYKNFPYASVRITDLLVLESEEFNNDTLIFAKLAYVNISLLNIITKNYNLEEITISDAKINIKYNNSNSPNFLVFKNPQKTRLGLDSQTWRFLPGETEMDGGAGAAASEPLGFRFFWVFLARGGQPAHC